MDEQKLIKAIEKFDKVRALVVGDLYLDEYIYADMAEISKEGPIPVMHIRQKTTNPGAAGNVACNLAALGAKVDIAGFIGMDDNGQRMLNDFKERKINTRGVFLHKSQPTNTYTKIAGGGGDTPKQEVLRIDTFRPPKIDSTSEEKIIDFVGKNIEKWDVILIIDQISSVITPKVLSEITRIAKASNKLLVADSREQAGKFHNCDLILPNVKEASLGSGVAIKDKASLEKAGRAILQKGKHKAVVVTRDASGLSIFLPGQETVNFPSFVFSVCDITGAGDTVTAGAALGLAVGLSPVEAAFLGDKATAIAIAKPGTATVTAKELKEFLGQEKSLGKIRSQAELKDIIAGLKSKGKKIVWTNGCFDILHNGHIKYLQEAKEQGDILVVGLNSDSSVKKIKGPKRPIIPQNQRAMVLSALSCVDYILIFDEPSPAPFLKMLKPDVYVKGGDYALKTLNQTERKIVEGYGGEIVLIKPIKDASTTGIIEKIIKTYGEKAKF